MKVTVNRSGGRLGWLDYLLTAVGSMLAVYSAGMSIDTPTIGLFCAALIIIGTCCSYVIRSLAGPSKMVRLDGPMYAIAAISAIVFAPGLMTMLPEGGFPLQMAAAGGLCWMLIFGSFLSWGDSTLLFQAVPGIALFGLVGCYDTYRNVVFAFFGFLICLCTGFARAHGREMLRQAAESGFFDRAGIRFDPTAPEQSAELFDTIRKGPWRWVAGPEWALLSALAIVFISLLGAPVIQSSVQGVAGFLPIHTPQSRRRQGFTASPSQDTSGTVTLGQGPVTGMTGQAQYEVKLDHPRYLRAHTYSVYTGRGWANVAGTQPETLQSLADYTLRQLKDPVSFDFHVSPRTPTRSFALPGEFDPTDITDSHLFLTADGGYQALDTVDVGRFFKGTGFEARDQTVSVQAVRPAPKELLPYVDREADLLVSQLARQVTRGLKNDREKAEAIMHSIVNHAQYNANVAPIPADRDAVAYFLFTAHEGYCDAFASAMVLMAREARIPARYVTGYLPDGQTLIDGAYVVRDTDFHAWAELFFKDVGWVVFDPTGISTMVPGGEVKVRSAESIAPSMLQSTLDIAIAASIAGAAWFLFKSRKRVAKTDTERRTEVERSYITFSRTLRAHTGRRRLLSETPSEYLAETKFALNGSYERAQRLTRWFEELLYSPGNPDSETVAQLEKELRELKQMLREEKKAKKAAAVGGGQPPSP